MIRGEMLGEAGETLKRLPIDQLKMFAKIREDADLWEALNAFVKGQKDLKLDSIYRLRRPRTQDDMIKNAVEHEYYAARISSLVVILQLCENASDELERRERKEK